MDNDMIVEFINNIAERHPELRQPLIDLATLAYRDGVLAEKEILIAEFEELTPDEVHLTPEELEDVVQKSEDWFRQLMLDTSRDMVARHNEQQQNGFNLSPGALNEFMNNMQPIRALRGNRVKIDMERLAEENPGLFD